MTTETITLTIKPYLAQYFAWYIHDHYNEICRAMVDQHDVPDCAVEDEVETALNSIIDQLQGTKP